MPQLDFSGGDIVSVQARILVAVLLAAGLGASAQLVVGVDDPNIPVYLIDVNSNTARPLFVGNEVWGLAADDANRTLYLLDGTELYAVSYDTLVPQLLGTITIGGSAASMVGLAFDAATGKLYSTRNIANEGVYEINLAMLEASLVWDYGDADYDFGGFDFDASTGRFYGTNDDSSPYGLGLYELNLGGGSATRLADYPTGETDIDGLAVGDGKAYLVIDQPGSIYVYNIATGQYEAPLKSPFGTNEIFSGAAWAPGLIPEPSAMAVLGLAVLPILTRKRR